MKKIFYTMMFSGVLFLTSCGPSACDCLENVKKGADADMSVAKKCIDKYGDANSKEFLEEIKDCN